MMKEYYDYVAHEVLINLKDGSKTKGYLASVDDPPNSDDGQWWFYLTSNPKERTSPNPGGELVFENEVKSIEIIDQISVYQSGGRFYYAFKRMSGVKEHTVLPDGG